MLRVFNIQFMQRFDVITYEAMDISLRGNAASFLLVNAIGTKRICRRLFLARPVMASSVAQPSQGRGPTWQHKWYISPSSTVFTYFRLPNQTIRIGEVQCLHDSLNRSCHLCWVRVATIHYLKLTPKIRSSALIGESLMFSFCTWFMTIDDLKIKRQKLEKNQ